MQSVLMEKFSDLKEVLLDKFQFIRNTAF